MSPCDAIGCNRPKNLGHLMCSKHWRLVPLELQRTINRQFRAAGYSSRCLTDLVYLQAAVDAVAAVGEAEGRDNVRTILVNRWVGSLAIAKGDLITVLRDADTRGELEKALQSPQP